MSPKHHHEAVAARRRRVLRSLAAIASVLLLALTQAAPSLASPASLQKQEWWIGRLGLQKVWQITKGKDVTVAVIDSGVDATVGDLHGALLPGFSLGDKGDPDVSHDKLGHGTSMAVKIAGRGTDPGILGVAPQSKIIPVYLPSGSDDTADVLARLQAMAHPPQVVNMSYGSAGRCPAALQAEIKTVVDKGMILVASAGNDGEASNRSQYPANCAGVVAVGAFDPYGKAWEDTQRQPYVSIGGPGEQIIDYTRARAVTTVNGTSDASAIVAGEFALLRAKFPSMPSRQLVARMFATASSTLYKGPGYGEKGDTLGFGPGLVHKALTQSVPASAPNPVYDKLAKIATKPSQSDSTSGSQAPSSTPSGPGAMPTGDVGASFPGGSDSGSSSSSSSSNGAVIGVVVAVVVVILIVVGLFLYRRRRTVHAGPGNHFPPTAGGP